MQLRWTWSRHLWTVMAGKGEPQDSGKQLFLPVKEHKLEIRNDELGEWGVCVCVHVCAIS